MALFLGTFVFPNCGAYASAGQEILLPRVDGKQTPLRLYGDWSRCLPTVLLSHGMGGDDTGLAYIGEALAANGYRAAVMGHQESGRSALRSMIFTRNSNRPAALLDPVIWEGRFDDLDAAFKYVTHNCRPPLLVLGGHSMGAATTMLEAGAKGKIAFGGANRFDAYIALSPQGVSWMFADTSAWQNVSKPVIMITGTDDSMMDETYQDRIVAFDNLPPRQKRLVVIDGASHMNIAGRGNETAQTIVTQAIVDYLGNLVGRQWIPRQYSDAMVRDK